MSPDPLAPVRGANPTAGLASLLDVSDLTVETRTREHTLQLLSDVNLTVAEGATLGVVGESGSGKSLTALSIMGLLPDGLHPTAGRIRLREDDLLVDGNSEMRDVRGREIGMIFQDPVNSLNPSYTIGSQLVETIRTLNPALDKTSARRRAAELLERVGIPDAAERLRDYPHQFSGGMAQRVMIALAICSDPSLLIADEPTTALDVTVQAQILSLLRTIQHDLSMTMILISHDLAVIAQMADDVTVMYAGEVVELGPVGAVFDRPRHPYTAALLAAQPGSTTQGDRLAVIPGAVPEAGTILEGCRFRDRCNHAIDVCVTEHPPLEQRGSSSVRCHRADELDLTPHELPEIPVHVSSVSTRDGTPLLQIDAVTRTFRRGNRLIRRHSDDLIAVADASLDIWPGETLGIVGESGAGKSTLGRVVLGLEQPTAGSVVFDGLDVHAVKGADRNTVRHDMSVVFQNPYASLDPSMSIAESVVEPLTAHERLSRQDRLDRAKQLLREVGLPESYTQRRPHELSGGQRQRVAIARALALRPRLVVCDEAVSALDVSTQAQVLNLLSDLQDTYGMAYMFIGHDLAVVRHISDRVAVMHHGHVVEIGPADDIYHRPSHPYTQALLSAVLSTDVGAQQIEPHVTTTSAAAPKVGCSFAPRCPHATDTCTQVRPELQPYERGEVACHLVSDGTLAESRVSVEP